MNRVRSFSICTPFFSNAEIFSCYSTNASDAAAWSLELVPEIGLEFDSVEEMVASGFATARKLERPNYWYAVPNNQQIKQLAKHNYEKRSKKELQVLVGAVF